MNSVIIPQLPPARVPGGYPGYGYGVPAQGYLSYTPAQQKFAAAAGFPPATQQHQPTTPTDVFSVAAAAMMQQPPRMGPHYFQQKRQFEFPSAATTSRESLSFPAKQQQQQFTYSQPPVTRYQPPVTRATVAAPPANRAPEVRTTSSTRPNRTKSEVCKPLFVDCSIEYDLPNVPKISAGKDGKAEPILMIHPAYLNKPVNRPAGPPSSYPQPVACNVRDCQCQMAVARQRQMLQQQQQQQQRQQQQLIRQQQQQQQVEATRKAVKRSYEANFQHQQTTMNAGKAKL